MSPGVWHFVVLFCAGEGEAFGGNQDEVLLIALNDRLEPLSTIVELEFISYDGRERDLKGFTFAVPTFGRAVVGSVPVPDAARLFGGTVVAAPTEESALVPVSWRHCAYRESGIPPAKPAILASEVVAVQHFDKQSTWPQKRTKKEMTYDQNRYFRAN